MFTGRTKCHTDPRPSTVSSAQTAALKANMRTSHDASLLCAPQNKTKTKNTFKMISFQPQILMCFPLDPAPCCSPTGGTKRGFQVFSGQQKDNQLQLQHQLQQLTDRSDWKILKLKRKSGI